MIPRVAFGLIGLGNLGWAWMASDPWAFLVGTILVCGAVLAQAHA